MVKNWRAAKMAALVTAAALVFCGGTAAADSGGSFPHPTIRGHHLRRHHRVPPPGAFGTVASVDGSGTAGTCGAAGDAGTFVLTTGKSIVSTVDVVPATGYVDPAITTPTFGDVCIGDLVGAVGPVSGDTVSASKVFVVPPWTPPAPVTPATTTTSVAPTLTPPAPVTGAGDPARFSTVPAPASPHLASVGGDPAPGFGSHIGGPSGAPGAPRGGFPPATHGGFGPPAGPSGRGGNVGASGAFGPPAGAGRFGSPHGRS